MRAASQAGRCGWSAARWPPPVGYPPERSNASASYAVSPHFPRFVACDRRPFGHAVCVSRFSFDFEFNLAVRRSGKDARAFFGQNVLQGLIDGIDGFLPEPIHDEPHRHIDDQPHEHVGDEPILLACAPWVDDHALVARIEALPRACVVISKEPRTPTDALMFKRLRQVNERTEGIEVWTFPELGDTAPKSRGKRQVIDPREPSPVLPTFRTIGYRRTGRRSQPIAHAKLALLGYVHVQNEIPHTDYPGGEFSWFDASRLWVSSANFTFASRNHLEFGYWTDDPDLISGAKRFLINLIGASEDLDTEADRPVPDLTRVEYDRAATAEVVEEMRNAVADRRAEEAELLGEESEEEDW
jgi:hypothetical protein